MAIYDDDGSYGEQQMRRRTIEIREYAYVVLNDQGERLNAYVTEESAMNAARNALALLGGGVIVRVDGNEERVEADPRVALPA